MSTKVCILTSVHRWNDIRIFRKQAKSLVKAGYQVHLVVPTDESGVKDGVMLNPVVVPSGRLKRILLTTYKVYKEAKKTNAEIYHFHDPELIFYAKLLSLQGKKVIYDSHEDVPADILDKEWISNRYVRKAVSKLYGFVEKKLAKSFDGVISVSYNITNKFTNANKATIANVPLREEFKNVENSGASKVGKRVVYAGGLTEARNIKQIVQSAGYIKDKEIEIHLFGEFDNEAYKNECQSLQEWGNVKYWGLKSTEEVYGFMQTCSLGLVMFKDIANHAFAIPNKAYEYMAAGIPLLISDLNFWKEHFEKMAYFVDPENPSAIALGIEAVFENSLESNNIAAKNKELVASKMNWAEESKKLINLYKSL